MSLLPAGQVLVVLEEKVKRRAYGSVQIREFLQFETESVPVHQFQARVAEIVLRHGGKGLHSLEGQPQMVPIINLALRVRPPNSPQSGLKPHTCRTKTVVFLAESILYKEYLRATLCLIMAFWTQFVTSTCFGHRL